MVATEALKNDHRVIEKVLHVLEAASKKIDQGGEVPIDVLKKAADFIRNFADSYHHGKEENILFKSMEEKGFPREGGPIGVMLMEHDEGRGYERGLVEGIEKYAAGDSSAKKTIVENARNFAGLLAPHIQKEDSILYMMADNILPEAFQKELLHRFDLVEKEKLGEGKRQYYVTLADELEKAVK